MFALELEQLQAKVCAYTPELRTRLAELRKQTVEISTNVQTMSKELHSAKQEYWA